MEYVGIDLVKVSSQVCIADAEGDGYDGATHQDDAGEFRGAIR